MPRRIQRRDFLKTTAAASAGYWLGVGANSARAESAGDKLNLAVIGLGGRGANNLDGVSGKGSQNIVALCDVDDVRAGKAYDRFPAARKFYDFRAMFDEMEKEIDGVVISTPDHTHFHPAWWAMQRGKHVYLEKPLAHSVWEVRELTKLAAEKKLATQLGAQRHTLEGLRRGVELVQAGAIGTVTECHSWVNSSRGMPPAPGPSGPVPDGLKWDLWLGPAADRPYNRAYVPYDWRFWWDFGTGETGNWGCHILDIPYWALGLRHPTRVEGSGPTPDAEKTPTQMATRLTYPANDKRGPVTLHWYQEKGGPAILKSLGIDLKGKKDVNTLFIGTGGMLLCGFGKKQYLLPEEKFKDFKQPDSFLGKSPGFYREWFDACRGGAPATCNFDYSGPMAEAVLLANIAYRVQGAFDWEAANLKASTPEAQKYIHTAFRKGWEV
jgi:predicted dehydrogenase